MISSSNKFAVLWIAHNTYILHYWYLAMSVCSRSCHISHAHFLILSYQAPPPLPSLSKLLMSIFDHSGEHCFRSVPHELEGKRIHTYKEIKDSTCWSTWKELSMI